MPEYKKAFILANNLISMPKIRTGLVFGGKSPEHEISIISARNIFNAINKDKFEMSLLPASFEQNMLAATNAEQRVRLICDYIAGMTDGFAIRTYKRLFDPDFGSLADLI